jgi:hypothetical protein
MLLLAIALLGLPALGVWCWLVDSERGAGFGLREAFAITAVVWAAYSIASVELLSLGAHHDLAAVRTGHLTRSALVAMWIVQAVVGAALLYRCRRSLASLVNAARELWWTADVRIRAALAVTAASILIVGLVAVTAAPNNWDSMTYHLSRVVAWIRLGGVSHYATNIEAQLYQPPGAEMLIAQWQLLVGGDRMSAIVQWFAFGGSAAVGSLTAARLGADRLGQALAALLIVTMPMAIMQGSSTQNDLVTAFWLLIAATLALGIDFRGEHAVVRTVTACMAIGLAVVTKGTALIYGLPVIAMIAGFVLRTGVSRKAVAALLAGAVLIVAPSIQHALQNHQTYGSYLATGSEGNFYKNSNIGPKTVLSNVVRNASVHMRLPGEATNRATEKTIRRGLEAFGINPDDPANTFGDRPFKVGKIGPHEDHAGNLGHLILGVWAVVVATALAAFRSRRRIAWAAMIVAQVLLFCALLKWQLWHSRLHLPVFVMLTPLIAACMTNVRRQWLVTVPIALLVLAAPVYLFYNYTRPLVGERSVLTLPRDSQYFLPRRNLEAPYLGVMNAIRDDRRTDVGVVARLDDWVYPLHALAGSGDLRFHEVMPVNDSKRYSTSIPDTVVCLSCHPAYEEFLVKRGFKARPFEMGPVVHDPHLQESGVAVTLLER